MSRRGNIKKRIRQKLRHALRLQQKPVDRPIAHIKTADLIADLAKPLRVQAFHDAIQEQKLL
jgi:hypothetical protein